MSHSPKILVTGAAGFIASKTAEILLESGREVVGIDNLNDYYDVRLKEHRLAALKKNPRFTFHKVDIEDLKATRKIFQKYRIESVLNLAARAGVPYSLQNPFVYMTTNANATLNLLELMRESRVKKMVMASTSSLYAGQKMPFKESLPVNTPISPYAASKKAAEVMAYTYSYLHKLDITIVRYFTVYGPAGRPDMSLFRFIKWIDEGKPVEIFGDGNQSRDFTYVDDIALGTIRAAKLKGFQIINLGGNKPYKLIAALRLIEKSLGKKGNLKFLPPVKTDIQATWADTSEAESKLGWTAKISLEEGIKKTVDWYRANKSWLKKIKV